MRRASLSIPAAPSVREVGGPRVIAVGEREIPVGPV
jgi:hypothetical protein